MSDNEELITVEQLGTGKKVKVKASELSAEVVDRVKLRAQETIKKVEESEITLTPKFKLSERAKLRAQETIKNLEEK